MGPYAISQWPVLPLASAHPDYLDTIACPVTWTSIIDSAGLRMSPAEFKDQIEQLCDNAQMYFGDGSEEHAAAATIRIAAGRTYPEFDARIRKVCHDSWDWLTNPSRSTKCMANE